MRRVSQQIGWSQESKLYYYVLRQLEQLTGIYGKNITTTTTSTSSSSTTTTSTTANPNPLLKVNPPSVNTFDIPQWTSSTGTDGDFTIEWLQYMHTDLDFPRVYSIGQYPAQNAVSIEGGVLYLWLNGSIQGAYPLSALPGGTYLDIWLHIAVCRYKGQIRVYITSSTWPAQEVISGTDASAIPTNGNDFYIGSENAPNTYYNGLISNFMFTKNYDFYAVTSPTYPTIPLTPIPETILLIGQGYDLGTQLIDQSGTNTITATNVTYNGSSGISGDFNGSLQFGTI
jgi:hypothetical protein